MANSNDFASAYVRLEASGWVQKMSTSGDAAIVVEATKTNQSSVLRVPGLGNIMELPFSINLVRGFCEWRIAGMPENAVGFLAHYDSDQQRSAFVGGGFWLSEAMFDDLWLRIRGGAYFETLLSLKATPIETENFGDMVWDRTDSKFLYIASADFVFTCKQREISSST